MRGLTIALVAAAICAVWLYAQWKWVTFVPVPGWMWVPGTVIVVATLAWGWYTDSPLR